MTKTARRPRSEDLLTAVRVMRGLLEAEFGPGLLDEKLVELAGVFTSASDQDLATLGRVLADAESPFD